MSEGNKIQQGYEGKKAGDCGNRGGIPASTDGKSVPVPGGRKGIS